MMCCASSFYAQPKYDYQWVFGSNASPNPGGDSFIIDFNNGAEVIDRSPVVHEIGDNNTMICNDDGQLLFYANGCEIIEANDIVLPNGSGISPGEVHNDWCWQGDYPFHSNSMILPDPANSQGYYYFHKDAVIDSDFPGNQIKLSNQKVSYIIDQPPLGVLTKNQYRPK